MPATVAPLTKADLAELEVWAERVCSDASGWAERAEVSRGERKEITQSLDALASVARRVASLSAVLHAR